MSCYLTIKKNGMLMGSWSRSSNMFKTFEHRAPYDDEVRFEPEKEFELGLKEVEKNIKYFQKRKQEYQNFKDKVGISRDEYFDTIGDIEEIDEILDELLYTKYSIEFMIGCYEHSIYEEDDNNYWTWGLG